MVCHVKEIGEPVDHLFFSLPSYSVCGIDCSPLLGLMQVSSYKVVGMLTISLGGFEDHSRGRLYKGSF